jgi:hypothetical protein
MLPEQVVRPLCSGHFSHESRARIEHAADTAKQTYRAKWAWTGGHGNVPRMGSLKAIAIHTYEYHPRGLTSTASSHTAVRCTADQASARTRCGRSSRALLSREAPHVVGHTMRATIGTGWLKVRSGSRAPVEFTIACIPAAHGGS